MATYKEIEVYVKQNSNFTPKSCWIAHAKEICGLDVKISHNRYSINNRTNPCPKNKFPAIKEAFIYFKMID